MNTLLEAPLDTARLYNQSEREGQGRIMVVDDDPDIRTLMIEALGRSGFAVDDAENGARAWKAVHLKNYDLIITDHEMPEMTGLQFVHKLRTAGFNLPVIFASGSVSPNALATNAWLKFSAVLPKPFTLEELIQTVKRLLPVSTPGLNP